MLVYLTAIMSAAVLLGASVAVLLLSGGWEAVAAGIAVAAGSVWLGCFVLMLAAEDRVPGGRGPHAV